MRATIIVEELPGGHITMTGMGDFDFAEHKDSLIAKATMAAADAINEVIQESNGFHKPIVAGEEAALKMTKMAENAVEAVPASTPTITWYDATSS